MIFVGKKKKPMERVGETPSSGFSPKGVTALVRSASLGPARKTGGTLDALPHY
jgi:hypothetical protein